MKAYILRRPAVGENAARIAEFMQDTKVVMKEDFGSLPAVPLVFRWGSTGTIPFETKTVNSAKAIHWAYDKRNSRRIFAEAGDAPKTWIDFGEFLNHSPNHFESFGGPDLIVRPEHHSKGKDMDVCTSLSEVYKASLKYPIHYISEFINKDREFRVYIVQGRVVNCIEKLVYDKSVLAWGDENAKEFKYQEWTDWPMEVIKCALRCHEKSGLVFSAVDLMTAGDKVYCLEINTAPEITPYVGKCYGQAFQYILDKGYQKALPLGPGNDFKSYIHPSRFAGAILG